MTGENQLNNQRLLQSKEAMNRSREMLDSQIETNKFIKFSASRWTLVKLRVRLEIPGSQ